MSLLNERSFYLLVSSSRLSLAKTIDLYRV